MTKTLLLKAGMHSFQAVLLEKEQPKACSGLLKHLPFKAKALRWGLEIYFYTDFSLPEEKPLLELEIGDIAFWHEGPGIGIFFGKTPASSSEKPKAYSKATRFARIVNPDVKKLDSVKEGEIIIIELPE